MLRRPSLAYRLVAGMLALWFAVVATEGARVHACAMHGGSVATQAAGGHGHGDVGGDMHAGHHAATMVEHGAPTQDHGAHQCTCPDASCGSAVVALVAPRLTTHFGVAVADVRAVFSPARGHRPAAPPYLTPFANGPPAAALA